METLSLSTEVLKWAASEAGTTLDELARKISKRKFADISDGLLTSSQAIKFSEKTRTPLGYLFLTEPPAPRQLPVADFRTLSDSTRLGREFFDVFDDIEYKQAWYRDYLLSVGAERLPFVGRFKGKRVPLKSIVGDMRDVLGFDVSAAKRISSSEELFALLSTKCERAGVLVFKNGVVGNNTKRRLPVSEFRGFVISDQIVPVIFINGSDAAAAWVFTLAHELAHIWLGESGVSDVSWQSSNESERVCNTVAAELLVPKEEFLQTWRSVANESSVGKLEVARRRFKVSSLVLALRALEFGLVDQGFVDDVNQNAKQHFKKASSGGDFYATLATRNSKTLSKKVASLAVSGSITISHAGRLLNTNPNNVITFYAKQNAISV